MSTHVLVVGGGFAGTMAAIRLARGGMKVSLVDPRSGFVERTRLHEAAASGRAVVREVPELDKLGVERIIGEVAALGSDHATLSDGRRVAFDRCILAIGSMTPASPRRRGARRPPRLARTGGRSALSAGGAAGRRSRRRRRNRADRPRDRDRARRELPAAVGDAGRPRRAHFVVLGVWRRASQSAAHGAAGRSGARRRRVCRLGWRRPQRAADRRRSGDLGRGDAGPGVARAARPARRRSRPRQGRREPARRGPARAARRRRLRVFRPPHGLRHRDPPRLPRSRGAAGRGRWARRSADVLLVRRSLCQPRARRRDPAEHRRV